MTLHLPDNPLIFPGSNLSNRRLLPVENATMPQSYRPDLKGILIPNEEIHRKIGELASALSNHYQDRTVDVIVIMDGAATFYANVLFHRNIGFVHDPIFKKASSYIGTTSSGQVDFDTSGITKHKGRDVLLIEDIVDTGITMDKIIYNLKEVGARDIKVCSLLDKPTRRKTDIIPHFTGFTIPNEFVVGFGLDYNNRYRGIPHVCVLNTNVYS